VRLHGLIDVVHPVDRYDGAPDGDRVQEFLQDRAGQIVGLAMVRGQRTPRGR
jgi:hypothetical protein